ncbi:MAG: BolA/IbaG family iron-sulfur metabolism protein, partial [Flavobacteriaceae bacterium]|nr:BolA/IbaG family iron-sulfur metabolism protein [Flavobacteriaceae bacterium]
NGMTKINIHRQINKILSDEFKRGLHALEIKVI